MAHRIASARSESVPPPPVTRSEAGLARLAGAALAIGVNQALRVLAARLALLSAVGVGLALVRGLVEAVRRGVRADIERVVGIAGIRFLRCICTRGPAVVAAAMAGLAAGGEGYTSFTIASSAAAIG